MVYFLRDKVLTLTRIDDERHMRRALELALEGWGRVAPNPMVGAVVVREGEVVGEGYHAEWGGPHAEVVALEAAAAKAEGATLYVTLEPCHHTGKTGPCSRAIAESGIRRVVCGTGEVSPPADGGGGWLRSQGTQVDVGVCELEARDLIAVHLHSSSGSERPFVAVKYAMSIDARLSQLPGESTEVTSGEAIAEAHRLRAGHDAVMVGIDTVVTDDPRLTVREWKAPRVPPLRVVLDSNLRTPLDSMLVRSAADMPVCVFTAEGRDTGRAKELETRGVEVSRVAALSASGGLDLGPVLARLRERGVRSVLCEGGGTLGSALLAARCVDRLYTFIAPRLFGDPGVPGFRLERGQAERDWRLVERKPLGPVTLLVLSPESAAA